MPTSDQELESKFDELEAARAEVAELSKQAASTSKESENDLVARDIDKELAALNAEKARLLQAAGDINGAKTAAESAASLAPSVPQTRRIDFSRPPRETESNDSDSSNQDGE